MLEIAYNTHRGDVMQIKTFNVIIRPCADGVRGYWAACAMPDGGINTDGETLQEVCANMFEAMDLYLEDDSEISEYLLNFEVQNA